MKERGFRERLYNVAYAGMLGLAVSAFVDNPLSAQTLYTEANPRAVCYTTTGYRLPDGSVPTYNEVDYISPYTKNQALLNTVITNRLNAGKVTKSCIDNAKGYLALQSPEHLGKTAWLVDDKNTKHGPLCVIDSQATHDQKTECLGYQGDVTYDIYPILSSRFGVRVVFDNNDHDAGSENSPQFTIAADSKEQDSGRFFTVHTEEKKSIIPNDNTASANNKDIFHEEQVEITILKDSNGLSSNKFYKSTIQETSNPNLVPMTPDVTSEEVIHKGDGTFVVRKNQSVERAHSEGVGFVLVE